MRPTFRTFGGVLSPGLTSYHVVSGSTARQPSSDKLPSILIAPAAREIWNVSPARLVCAIRNEHCVNINIRNRAAIQMLDFIYFSLVVAWITFTDWLTRKARVKP